MKKIIISIFILTTIVACKTKGDPYILESIDGNVYLEDNLFQTSPEIAADALVYLSANILADPYLLPTKADKDGYYNFDFQPAKDPVFLVGKVQKNGIWYKGNLALPSASHDLTLNPVYPQGLLQISVSNDKGLLKGADVYVFVNESQANSINDDPKDFIQPKQVTNEKGVAAFFGLRKNDYYVVAKKGDLVTATVKVSFSQNEVDINKMKTIPLTFVTPAVSPKLIVSALNDANEIMANVDIYIFTSLSQANSIKTDSPVNYVATQKANSVGEATFSTLKTGIPYYIAAKEVTIVKTVNVPKTPINITPYTLTMGDVNAKIIFDR